VPCFISEQPLDAAQDQHHGAKIVKNASSGKSACEVVQEPHEQAAGKRPLDASHAPSPRPPGRGAGFQSSLGRRRSWGHPGSRRAASPTPSPKPGEDEGNVTPTALAISASSTPAGPWRRFVLSGRARDPKRSAARRRSRRGDSWEEDPPTRIERWKRAGLERLWVCAQTPAEICQDEHEANVRSTWGNS